MPVLLEACGLTVRRGRRIVLSDVSLALHPGEAVHLAGANGSGKTSLLRVLTGLAAPRSGRLHRHDAAAFVPDKVVLAPALRCGEWLRAMRRLRRLEPVDWSRAVAAGGLDPEVLDRPSTSLSKGMLQRIALLEALHAGCSLLLLDEPFSGLDPEGRDWLADQLAERLRDGGAVLLTDHSGAAGGRLQLAEVLQLRDGTCDCMPLPARPGAQAQLTVRAVHPDGRRLQRAVLEDAADDLLRTLLSEGWHVEELRR